MNKFLSKENTYAFWKIFFEQKKLNVVELTPEQHDKYAANSQGVAHFIGRLLDDFKLSKTPIDSLGAKKLQEIREQTCNDTWELFTNLQNFNSFTKGMRLRIGNSYDKLYNKLLPKRVNKNYLVYGIQGGIGSFNEQALQMYVQEKQIAKYQIKYLYRTENVLKKLHEGIIDYGLFAIHNTLGGLVQETLHSIPKYKFKINFEFDMQIKHYLMKRKDVDASHVITIMAHPQVLRQCKNTLQQKFPTLLQTSGEAELIDTAKAAEALASGKLPNTTAILGPKNLADRYKFDIIAENLQDSEENFTHFLVVSRI